MIFTNCNNQATRSLATVKTNLIRCRQFGQGGVTLIEVLVVMGMLSAMLVVLATVFTSAADTQLQSKSYSATLSNGQFIMARLNYDIARASAVTTPASLGDSGATLTLVIGGNNYTYDVSGGDLRLTDNTGTDNLNGNDATISGLNFQELGNSGGKPTILYSFTVTSVAEDHGVHDAQTYSSAAGLR
jgi:type II secretory pathway pseudopilin PulG